MGRNSTACIVCFEQFLFRFMFDAWDKLYEKSLIAPRTRRLVRGANHHKLVVLHVFRRISHARYIVSIQNYFRRLRNYGRIA